MTTNDTMTAAMTADEAQRLLTGTTPGEWCVYKPSEYPEDFRLASMQGPPVRYVGRLTRSHPNEPHPTKSDAALCAAAPRLAETVVALHAEVTALQKRVRNAEAMRDTFVGVAAKLASTDEALAATEAQQERDALHAQLVHVTAERDALRALAIDLVPRCGFGACDDPATHESPGVLRTEWACDEHHRTIEHPMETEHADAIRTLPRGR